MERRRSMMYSMGMWESASGRPVAGEMGPTVVWRREGVDGEGPGVGSWNGGSCRGGRGSAIMLDREGKCKCKSGCKCSVLVLVGTGRPV
jgi:hypothetical protein